MDISQSRNTDGLAETPQQSKITDALKSAVEHFNLLPSKVNRHILKYGYVYFSFFLILYLLLDIFASYLTHHTAPHNGEWSISFFLNLIRNYFIKYYSRDVSVLCLIISAFFLLFAVKIWQAYVPKMLQDLVENKRISARDSNITTRYQCFLEDYRRTLSGPASYLLSGILVICYMIYPVNEFLSHPLLTNVISGLPSLLFLMITMLFLYFIGTTLSAIFISGKYLRKLLRDFQVRSNPTHPDKCGGLKILGNFCWLLALPLLVSFIFFLVNGLISKWLHPDMNGLPVDLSVTLPIVFVLALPITIWASIGVLWIIHTQMVHEGEIYQQNQSIERDILQNQLRHLLDENELEQAKVVKEKRELVETLYTSYPAWPFIAKVQISSAFLLSIFSAALSVITQVLPSLFHIE